MKRSALKRKSPLERKTKLRRVSAKRAREGAFYSRLKRAHMLAHPNCQYPRCQAPSVDLHHREGRLGGKFIDQSTFLALCRFHHDKIHRHPSKARKLGLLA